MPATRTSRIAQPAAVPARKGARRAPSPALNSPAAPAPSKKAVAVKAPAPKAPRKNEEPRPKLVRDSFTMPEADFALIPALKERALKAQRATKKSELLRAGLQALAALDDKALIAALGKLEPVQTGRPKKGR
jgi:hypothetical protein